MGYTVVDYTLMNDIILAFLISITYTWVMLSHTTVTL